jgi:hypothetical protein
MKTAWADVAHAGSGDTSPEVGSGDLGHLAKRGWDLPWAEPDGG